MATVFQNPPVTATPVMETNPDGKMGNRFSTSWYQWLANLAARLNAPVIAGTPASSAAPAIGVQLTFDSNFLYIRTGTQWKRVPLNTF